LFDFSVLLGDFLVSNQLVGYNASVHALTKYFLPFSVLVSSLVLVVFRFDAQQIRLRNKAKNENGGDINADRAGDMANTWSWEILPTEIEELAPKKSDDDHVPFTQRRRESKSGYGVHSVGRRGIELELSHTPNDEIFNQFGIRTVSTCDMSVEEVIRKFGVLESMPSYNPPEITKSNSLLPVEEVTPKTVEAEVPTPAPLAAPAPITTTAAAPIARSRPTSPTKSPIKTATSGGSSAYNDAVAILGNRMKPTNVPIPKTSQNLNHAAINSSGHLAAAMASLNTPIPKANPYAAARPPAAKVDDKTSAATTPDDTAASAIV
jgi:hypothetical protein